MTWRPPISVDPPKKGRPGQVAYVRVTIHGSETDNKTWVVTTGPDGVPDDWCFFLVNDNCLLTTLELRQALMKRMGR